MVVQEAKRMIIVDVEYCKKCGKYMQYNEEGRCIKCNTIIYISKSIKNNECHNTLKDMGMSASEIQSYAYDRDDW